MKVVFQAQENEDSQEGRGQMIPIGTFVHRSDADKAAKGKGVMGVGDGQVVVLSVYESFAEFEDAQKAKAEKRQVAQTQERENARQRALNKLTPEEKTLLGL